MLPALIKQGTLFFFFWHSFYYILTYCTCLINYWQCLVWEVLTSLQRSFSKVLRHLLLKTSQ